MTTATRSPGQVAIAIFDAVNARDPDGIVAHIADDVADDFVALGKVDGKPAVHALFTEIFAAFPDFAMTVDRVVSDETSAVVQWRATGTFSGGPFQGIRATGRRVELKGADVMEVSEGLMRRNTIYYDGATFARQVGLLPPLDSRRDRAVLAAFNAVTRIRRRAPRG